MESRKISKLKSYLRNFFSELVGTAVLVSLGCFSEDKSLDQEGDRIGVVLSFSLAVFIAVQIACHNSGGHVNPAVTVLSLFFKKLSFPMAIVYILGQLSGGIVGFGLLKLMIPSDLFNTKNDTEYGLCSTVPHKSLTIFQATLIEFCLTTVLLLVVCTAWDPRNAHHDSLTIKFGLTVFTLAYAGGPYTGCSMNPARSFGPAIWNQTWKHHWIYWISPLFSALFCGFLYTRCFCPKIVRLPESNARDGLEMNS